MGGGGWVWCGCESWQRMATHDSARIATIARDSARIGTKGKLGVRGDLDRVWCDWTGQVGSPSRVISGRLRAYAINCIKMHKNESFFLRFVSFESIIFSPDANGAAVNKESQDDKND